MSQGVVAWCLGRVHNPSPPPVPAKVQSSRLPTMCVPSLVRIESLVPRHTQQISSGGSSCITDFSPSWFSPSVAFLVSWPAWSDDHQAADGRTFASPLEASKSPPEQLAYVVALHAGTSVQKPDYLATIDVDPKSSTYSQVIHRLTDALHWR